MKEEIFKRIDILSEKLGVAASKLWEIYVKQQMIVGYELIVTVITIQFFWFLVAYLRRKYREDPQDNEGFLFSSIIVAIVIIVATFGNTIYAINYLANPEYYAFQELANAIRIR